MSPSRSTTPRYRSRQKDSLPNFNFHATSAYDILRAKGVPLGKHDFLGRLRLKT